MTTLSAFNYIKDIISVISGVMVIVLKTFDEFKLLVSFHQSKM